MSTNEQNKTQEINQNGLNKFETIIILENQESNSVKSAKNSQEKGAETEVIGRSSPENEVALKKGENVPVSSCYGTNNKGNNQESGDRENSVPPNDSYSSIKKEGTGETETTDNSASEEMSRSTSIKSRLPNKTSSRSALAHSSPKVSSELSGQPSARNTKDDVKYWKNREQELLSRIAELENKVTNKDSKDSGSQELNVSQNQERADDNVLAASKEKENYKNKLQAMEKEAFQKQKDITTDSNFKHLKNLDEVSNHLKVQNEDLRNALAKMTAILRDKTTMCISQEKKIAALVNQVESLKEVVAITKDLLNIRNMEVQHLSNDISSMETKIDCERQRHNQMLIKMDEAVKLNSDLKKEYENQLRLFQHLRDSYEEKILLLSRDNNAGTKDVQAVGKGIVSYNKNSSETQVQNAALLN